jgi:hypothetical protein
MQSGRAPVGMPPVNERKPAAVDRPDPSRDMPQRNTESPRDRAEAHPNRSNDCIKETFLD